MPELHIITGSNGAGKSTVGSTYLPKHILNSCDLFDGDKTFWERRKELMKDRKVTPKEAGNIAGEWLIEHFEAMVTTAIKKREHFAYEGHFTEEASWNTIRRFKKNKYSVHLVFFGLKDQDQSQMRVIERTQSGGHYVQPAEIDRNFEGNLLMLDKHFELLDFIRIVDTTTVEHRMLATLSPDGPKQIVSYGNLPEWFVRYLPRLTKRIFHGD